jgi:hypothetical protein
MVKDTFSRILVLIVIAIEVLHSLTRIVFGDIWVTNLFNLVSLSLWVTILLSLYSAINRYENRAKSVCVILLLLIVYFCNALLVFLSDCPTCQDFHKVKTLAVYLIAFIQVVVTFIAGLTLKNYKDKPIRTLGKVFIIQSVLYFVLLFWNQLLFHSLNRVNTIVLIINFYYVSIDALEIFVLIYIYRVFDERYEE